MSRLEEEQVSPSITSITTPPRATLTATSVIKRALIIPSVTIFLVILYVGATLLKPAKLDASVVDTSDQHVAQLLTQWENEKKAEKLNKLQSAKELGSSESSNRKTVEGDNKVILSRKYLYRKQQENMRNSLDLKVIELANVSSGIPKYHTFDMLQTESRTDGAGAAYDCINLKISPRTPICLYDSKQDVFVSKQIRELGIWEEHIVVQFQSVLSMNPGIGVIDIGANIGQYSLIAASMGHPVLAVEPWGPSLSRFKTAAKMANIESKITVLQNSISNERSLVCLNTTNDNQGNVYIDNASKKERVNCNGSNSIYLDDLLPFVRFKKAVLKLDIQGFEHRAFLHARRLLSEIFVPFIFIEWVMMREMWLNSSHESLDKAIVRYLVELLTDLDYRVFSLVSRKELDIRYWHGWPEDVIWIHKSQIEMNKNPIQM